jgi:hypothetical protein
VELLMLYDFLMDCLRLPPPARLPDVVENKF